MATPIHDIKWDGTRYHTSFWCKSAGKRVFIGYFHSKSVAKTERDSAMRQASGYLNI